VRSTPARLLHQDQLLVDRYAVHKINKVEYPLPQNIVAVELTNQITGEQSTRNLRWEVNFWAHQRADEITMAQLGLGGSGLEAGQ
jgi:hypothetical protein